MTQRLDPARFGLAACLAGTCVLVGLLAGFNPPFAIGASIGLAFVLVAFTNLAIALSTFVMLAFFEATLPAGSVVSVSKLAGLVLAAAVLARLATSSDPRENFFTAHPQGTLILFAFLGWGTLSIAWSDSSSATLVSLTRYLLDMVLAIVVYTAVRERKHVKWVIGVWVAGTAITALYGLATHPAVGAEAERASSSVGDANVFAAVLVAGLVLALAGAMATRKPLLRMIGLGIAALSLFGFVFTGSRSGVLSLVAVLMAAIVFGGRWRGRVLAGTVILGITAVLTFAAFAPTDIKQRITQTTPGQVPDTEGRLTLWQVAERMAKDRPVEGVGLGSFQASAPSYLLEPGVLTRTDQIIDTPKEVHNIYLQALAETGIIGLVLFLFVLGFFLRCGVQAARNFARTGDVQMEILARAAVIALIGILTADFFVPEQYSKLLWLMLGLGPALLAVSTAPEARSVPRYTPAPRLVPASSS